MSNVDTINFTLDLAAVPNYTLEVDGGNDITATLDTAIVINQITGDIYDGEYIVDPSFEQQTLETRNKTLTDDVTVNAIMVSRTTNTSGGYTVYIGGEIDYA